jgi:hypothetical protein
MALIISIKLLRDMERIKTYKSYKKVIKGDGLKQQLFLQKYVIENDINRLLLFHGIGTGKTRSSILIAEALMKQNRNLKVNVILPARLKTNYIDELMIYFDTIPKLKALSKEKKLDFLEERYEIMSYEYIINLFKKSTDINATLKKFTKNRILIIDEFHNLIANAIQEDTIDDIYKKNKLKITTKDPIRALIMRYIARYAHDSCKMFFLSATPVFDNYRQFIELVKLLNKNEIKKDKDLNHLVPYLKGKISYYNSDDRSDFPSVSYDNLEIPLSNDQFKKMLSLQKYENDGDDTNDEESFMMKQRQIGIALSDDASAVIRNLDKYAPKLKMLFKLIDRNEGKHLIYSNFVGHCLKIIQKYLDKNGWSNYLSGQKNKYKSYVLWDGTLKDQDKIKIKEILNSKDNVDGNKIRVILGSPSIKEGISFKHIQHLHQIDPVWNISAKNQIEGRCIRFKSHEDISPTDKKLKRKVIVHNYICIAPDGKKRRSSDHSNDNEEELNIEKRLMSIIKSSKKRVLIYSKDMKVYVPILKKIMKKYKVIKYSKKVNDSSSNSSNSNKTYVVLTKKEMIDNMNINILFAKADILKFKGERYNFDDIIRQRTSSKKKEKPEGFMTCDEKIYYNIIPKKEKLIKRIEVILKKSAVDYYLYNSLSRTPIVSSEVKFSSNGMTNIGTNRDNGKKEGNRCPKKRRPVNGLCASKYILAKNKYGNDCCYKKKKI